MQSNRSVKYHQDLIDQWGEPDDLGTKMAHIIKEYHKMYGLAVFAILEQIKTSCKHPKRDHQICDGTIYCTNCNLDLGKVKKPAKKAN